MVWRSAKTLEYRRRHAGIGGRAGNDLAKQLHRYATGAGEGGQQTARAQQLHGIQIDVLVATRGALGRCSTTVESAVQHLDEVLEVGVAAIAVAERRDRSEGVGRVADALPERVQALLGEQRRPCRDRGLGLGDDLVGEQFGRDPEEPAGRGEAHAACVARPTMSVAAEPPPAERVLVDLQTEPAVRLVPNRIEAKFAKSGDRLRLEAAASADRSYPGVRLEPTAGPWNLEGYETVTAVVRNLGEVSTRVLLIVNNPGADSRNGCSANGLTLGPGERGLLTVTLGEWYGQAKPLDTTKIANCEFLVDRPQQPQRVMPIALEAEHRVDHVLEHPRPSASSASVRSV